MPDPSTDPTPQATVVPWWQSQIIRRLALSIIAQLVVVLHLSKYVASADIAPLTDDLLELAGLTYAAWAVHARATKSLPPVAISQAAANRANAAGSPVPNPTPPPPAAKP